MNRAPEFKWDVFLSYSSRNKATVQDIANRLKSNGVRVWFDEWEIRPGDSIPARIEDGLENSRLLVLCMSAEAFGSDWAQLESHTFRFKDPLNHDRRFIPLKLDDFPVKESIAQFSHIDWRKNHRDKEFTKLLESCFQIPSEVKVVDGPPLQDVASMRTIVGSGSTTVAYAFSEDCRHVLSGGVNNTLTLCEVESGAIIKEMMGHTGGIKSVAFSPDEQLAMSGSWDNSIRIWNLQTGACLKKLFGHGSNVRQVAWVPDQLHVLSVAEDETVRIWHVETGSHDILHGHSGQVHSVAWRLGHEELLSGGGDNSLRLWDASDSRCIRIFEGHTGAIWGITCSDDGAFVVTGSEDATIRVWDLESGVCKKVLNGHTGNVRSIKLCQDSRFAVSGSSDKTVRIWDLTLGKCLLVLTGHKNRIMQVGFDPHELKVCAADYHRNVGMWILPEHLGIASGEETTTSQLTDNVQYTNAKVLLVGNSGAGKTGLAGRLVCNTYKETDSTVGAWATQWELPISTRQEVPIVNDRNDGDVPQRQRDDRPVGIGLRSVTNVEREVWMWDFGGQADQRLIHQLYMDQTQVAALVFDPQKDDVLETLGQWDRDLSRTDKDKSDRDKMTKLLVAGRCDAGGLRVARSQIENFVKERGYAGYYSTSAKKNEGCGELKQAIIDGINWENIPWRSSPKLFKQLKDEIIRLKEEDRVLLRFNELREVLALRMQGQCPRFTNAELKAVVRLLAGPGVVWELEFGSWVLLQPERINAYAQAVIQTIREDEFDRGCISEQRVLNGDLTYHSSAERLAKDEEQFVLLAMHQILVERGLCIRHQVDSNEMLLVFPSYYRRERQEVGRLPAVQISYTFNGFLDEIYATLVVKLHHTREFTHDKLWKDAADFKTQTGEKSLGLRLIRKPEGKGELQAFFSEDMPVADKIIFSKYIHEHLLQSGNNVRRFRHYVCLNEYRGHLCGTTANRDVAMERLEDCGDSAELRCQRCDAKLELWDELEERFADDDIRQRVQDLRDAVKIRLDTESKERVLVGEVISTVALAGQICREIQVSDWGIDAEVEFKNNEGEASAKRVWLQLKSGDSFLTTRKKDGAAIFKAFNQRQAQYWMDHSEPVMLLIRNSRGEVSWIDIREELRRATNNGLNQVRQVVFDGKRFDVMSVRRWRELAFGKSGE